MKSGLYRLVTMTAVGLRITPVNATCDFMTAGRKTIFVNIGKEIPDTKSMKKAELEKTVQRCMGR